MNMKKNKETLVAFLLAVAVFLPVFFRGGRNEWMLLFTFIVLIIIIVLSYRMVVPPPVFHPFWLLAALVLWAFIHVFLFSTTPYFSFKASLILLAALGVFYSTSFLLSEDSKKTFAFFFIVISSIVAILGLIFFIQSENFGYLRLVSTFYHHNGVSNFLIIPFFLSLWWMLERKNNGRVLVYAAPVLFSSALFLTFSRGAFISISAGMFLFLFLLWRMPQHRTRFFSKLLIVFILITFGAAIGWGLYSLKRVEGSTQGFVGVSPYAGEREGESAFGARLSYMEHALILFKERPFLGYGLDSFGIQARRVQKDARFYSVDPHNIYLRLFSELGIIGGVMFLGFLVLVLGRALYMMRGGVTLFSSTFLSGFIALLIHHGGDFGFQFPTNVITFFITAAFLEKRNVQGVNTRWFPVAFLGILLFGAASIFSARIGAVIFSGAYADLSRNDTAFFERVKRAFWLDPLNPFYRFAAAKAAVMKGDVGRGFEFLKEAELLHPYGREIFLERGALYLKHGKLKEAEEAYRTSMALAPYKDLKAVKGLADILQREGRLDELHILLEEAVGRFPINSFDSQFWIDPEKEKIREDVILLNKLLEKN